MKRKTLSLTLCLLTCLALIGVGFAAWLITYNGTAYSEGNIVVETVNTQNYVITVTPVDSANIRFTPKADASISNPWLTYTTEPSNQEKLTAVFDVTVNLDSSNDAEDKDKIQLNIPGQESVAGLPTISSAITLTAGETEWTQAKTKEVVAGDLTTTWTLKSSTDGKYVYTVTVTGAWGRHFENKNPYSFYNAAGKSAANAGADAKEYLEFVAALSTVKYKLTLTVVAPASAK